jgi:hypothetical protein
VARVDGPSDRFSVEVFDVGGALILQFPAAVVPEECLPVTPSATPEIVAYVPFDGRAARWRLVDRGRIVHEATIAQQAPTLEDLTVRIDGTTLRARWRSSHPRPLTHNVAVSVDGGAVFPLGLDVDGTSLDAEIGHLPGGERCVVLVVATDGTRSAAATSEPFAIEGRRPFATITAPVEGDRVGAQEPFSLIGLVVDASGDALPDEGLRWHVDGRIVGEGSRLVGVPSLDAGTHEIRLSYEGVMTAESATVTIHADEPSPEVVSWRRDADEAERQAVELGIVPRAEPR